MKVALKNHAGFCGTATYTVTQAKVAGAEEGCEWSFNFSYADGQANVYAWVVVDGTGEEVELVIAEDDNITHEGVVRFWEVLSKNVFKQAAFVRNALPDAILAWWKTPTAMQICAERITIENLVCIIEGPSDSRRFSSTSSWMAGWFGRGPSNGLTKKASSPNTAIGMALGRTCLVTSPMLLIRIISMSSKVPSLTA